MSRPSEAQLLQDSNPHPHVSDTDLLRAALESTGDGVWVWDVGHARVSISPYWREITGLPAEASDIAIAQWRQLVHPDDLDRQLAALQSHVQGEVDRYESEYRLRSSAGGWVWVLDRGRVLERDERGNPLRAAGMYRDVSERREVEATLRIKESALEASIVGIVLADMRGRITYANPAMRDMWRLEPKASMIGWRALRLWAKTSDVCEATKALEERGLWSGELVAKRVDGSEFDVVLSANLVRDKNGEVVCSMASCIDVTRLKQAELRLQQAATVFESTQEAVVITDCESIITAVNKAFTEITGIEESDALGQPISVIRSDRHDSEFYSTIWSALLKHGQWQGEIWNRKSSGEVFPAWLNISSVKGGDGDTSHYVSVFSDISAIKRSQDMLDHLAHHDALTGLPNRLLFNDRLQHALDRVHRHNGSVAVLFLDLDRFKVINDSFGHFTGDELLKAVSLRLRSCVREQDTVARLGGDEFTVIMEDLLHSRDAAVVAQKIIDVFSKPFLIGGNEFFTSCSIGISICPDDGDSVETIVRNADAAMYRAKSRGRNNYQYFVTELTETAFQRYLLETGLRHALERNELEIHYQPQFSAVTGAIVAVEALVRWRHPQQGLLLPGSFLSVAEETGLMRPLCDWVLETACGQWVQWSKEGLPVPRLAVNLSTQQIYRGDLVELVHRTVESTGIDPLWLELEITEGFIVEQLHEAIEAMERLRSLGVTLSIDDFGTGYSSLSYLKRLPIHRLKIDRSFVRDIPNDPEDEAIARAVIALGRSLQMTVIAEGVETEAQRQFLREEGCDLLQGFLLSPPMDSAQLRALLVRQGTSEIAPARH